MPTKNISLSPQQAKFVQQSIKDGGFRNASEVLRAGLRLLEQEKQSDKLKLETLRKLSDEANKQFARGEYDVVSVDEIDEYVSNLSPRRGTRKVRKAR